MKIRFNLGIVQLASANLDNLEYILGWEAIVSQDLGQSLNEDNLFSTPHCSLGQGSFPVFQFNIVVDGHDSAVIMSNEVPQTWLS